MTLETPKTPVEAFNILVQALIYANKKGVFELGDASMIYTSIKILEEEFKETQPEK